MDAINVVFFVNYSHENVRRQLKNIHAHPDSGTVFRDLRVEKHH